MAQQQASEQANRESGQRAGQQATGTSDQQVAEAGRQAGTGRAGEADLPTFVPPTDIYETKDAVVMLMDMPGADPDSLDVTLERRELTVSARSMFSAPQGYTPVYVEYREGNYERAFTLSDQVDSERIEAMLRDGVLRLTLPKAPQAQAKKIEVKSA